jgi:hypothetical protein
MMSTVSCKCHEQPSLTGKEIALLEDAGLLEVMRVLQLGLSLEAVRLVLQLQQVSAIEHIEVSNCLVSQVVCEQVLGCDVPMSTIERQLLQDIRLLCMLSTASDFAEDAAMLEAKFGSNYNILELARVGPRALTRGGVPEGRVYSSRLVFVSVRTIKRSSSSSLHRGLRGRANELWAI